MKKLKRPSFINPFRYNSLPCTAIVENGRVLEYEFVDEPYPDGTCVLVSIDFTCEDMESINRRKRERQAENTKFELLRLQAQSARREDAKAFNESLNVPVRWRPEIKPVLSGLTANSVGNGANRRTVHHVYLLEELNDGRLHRAPNTYLCGKGGAFHELVAGDDSRVFETQVTCKACLKIAKRWLE